MAILNMNKRASEIHFDNSKTTMTATTVQEALEEIARNIGLLNIISFTINSMGQWQAEDGMTWEEWCNSDYNTDGFYCENGEVFADGGIPIYDEDRTNPVLASDTIIADCWYTFVI